MTAGGSVRSAQKVVDVLSAQGVEYIFGVPGAMIDAVYDALVDGGPLYQNSVSGPCYYRKYVLLICLIGLIV